MNEFVFAPSYRDLSRGCCMSIICLLIRFSLKSATETSECKAHVANSQWQRVPDRRAGSDEAYGVWHAVVVAGRSSFQPVSSRSLQKSTDCQSKCQDRWLFLPVIFLETAVGLGLFFVTYREGDMWYVRDCQPWTQTTAYDIHFTKPPLASCCADRHSVNRVDWHLKKSLSDCTTAVFVCSIRQFHSSEWKAKFFAYESNFGLCMLWAHVIRKWWHI